jgi:predicted permease
MIRLFNWFRRRSMEHGLDRELQYHFDRRVADLTAAGISEPEARRRVAVELGITQVREEVRDVWLTRWLRDFLYDLRFSARSFLRSPGFTAATLLSLALGIGATTAIYSLVDQVILHALPVRDPGSLVLVDWNADDLITGATGSSNLMPRPVCRELQQQTRFLDGVLCRAEIEVNLTAGGDPLPVAAEIVSGSYFSVLGVAPALGRVIEPEDDAAPGGGPVVVLAYDFWQAHFGGVADIVGRKVLIGNRPMTVVGVAAAGFRGVDVGAVPTLWMPTSMYADANVGADDFFNGPERWLQILARLRPGVSAAQAQTGLLTWFRPWLEDSTGRPGFPVITAEKRRLYLTSSLIVTPAPQGHSPLRSNLSQPLWLLFAATGVLLGLACLNVAGLFLARGSARGREIGTRLALGASRGRIGRQLLADSLLLAVAGGVLGVALAPPAMRALIAFLPHDLAANALRPSLSLDLLGFALLTSIAAGLFSGLAPALQAGRDNVVNSLRERGGTGFGGVRLRKAIVTLQVAFSLILLVGAALFLRTLTGLLAKGPGFDTSSLLSFAIDPLPNGYSRVDASRLVRRLDEQVRALPAARSAATARFAVLTGGHWHNVLTVQTDHRFVTEGGCCDFNSVGPGFFATLGVRILAGRDFDQRDSRPPGEIGPRSAIVNEAFVKHYLAGRDPLGVLIARGGGASDVKPTSTIVGVVADISYRGVRDHSDQVFFPLFEHDDTGATFYIKVRGAPEQAISSIRRLVRQDDPRLPILWFRTLDAQVNRSLNTERMLAALSGSFGALALLLSLVGLYGVMSFVVTRRTREIGIRLALGATRASALRLVLRDAVTMIAAGVALALPCVAALGKLVQSQLFGVTATDPATIAAAAMVLAAGALAAAFMPAWRASNVSPTDALRLE